jgi:hypothetical protein
VGEVVVAEGYCVLFGLVAGFVFGLGDLVAVTFYLYLFGQFIFLLQPA